MGTTSLEHVTKITRDDIEAVEQLIRPHIRRTPVIELTDASRGQRVGRDTVGGRVHGTAGAHSIGQRGSEFWFNPDDFYFSLLDAIGVPRGDATDETSATDSDQTGVEVGSLLLEFRCERALAEQRFKLVKSVNLQGARFFGPLLAGSECVGVTFAAHDQRGSEAADFFHLRSGRYRGNENPRGNS